MTRFEIGQRVRLKPWIRVWDQSGEVIDISGELYTVRFQGGDEYRYATELEPEPPARASGPAA